MMTVVTPSAPTSRKLNTCEDNEGLILLLHTFLKLYNLYTYTLECISGTERNTSTVADIFIMRFSKVRTQCWWSSPFTGKYRRCNTSSKKTQYKGNIDHNFLWAKTKTVLVSCSSMVVQPITWCHAWWASQWAIWPSCTLTYYVNTPYKHSSCHQPWYELINPRIHFDITVYIVGFCPFVIELYSYPENH